MDQLNATTRRPLRVVIVDDHPMVRDLVRIACEERDGLEVVGETGDGLEGLSLCTKLAPDVVILDLTLPRMDGFDVMKRIKAEGLPTRVLIVSGTDDPSVVLNSLRLGADGYLHKTGSVEQIAAAIEAVAAGTQVFSVEHQRGAQAALGNVVRKARQAAKTLSSLTPREQQVVQLIAGGLTTRQMATRLKVSERTVETHISNLYQKLGVKTRMQAVHRAAALGLVDLVGGGHTRTEAGS